MAKANPQPDQPKPLPMPEGGGLYSRDAVTGELTQIPPEPEPAIEDEK